MLSLRQIPRRFARDRRGVAALEFAIIAPLMILFYFGLAEFTQAMMAERKASRTASAVGDLVAQNSQITVSGDGGITDIFAIASTLMKPFATGAALKICLVSITANSAGTKTVAWTENQGDSTCPAKGASMSSVSSDLIGPSQSLIMSRVKYSYTGTMNQILKVNPTFTKTYYLRPRRSTQVTCSDC